MATRSPAENMLIQMHAEELKKLLVAKASREQIENLRAKQRVQLRRVRGR